ncbi:MAG: hypothetical protein Rhims3KO_17680 [Hyphomicrobiales bacterium]
MVSSQSQPKQPNEDGEEPLDPRLEAVAIKMRRLSLVSSGIMFLGVFAVLGVILYRSMGGSSSADVTTYPVPLPADEVRELVVDRFAGARVTGVSADATSVFVSVAHGDGQAVLEIDRATWQVVSIVQIAQ